MRIMYNFARLDYSENKWNKDFVVLEKITSFWPCLPESDSTVKFYHEDDTKLIQSLQPVKKEIIKKVAEDLLKTGFADLSSYKDIVFVEKEEYNDASRK